MGIKCPCCAEELHCPCKNCSIKNKDKPLFIWIDGEYEKCCKCGFTMHADGWLDWEYQLLGEGEF